MGNEIAETLLNAVIPMFQRNEWSNEYINIFTTVLICSQAIEAGHPGMWALKIFKMIRFYAPNGNICVFSALNFLKPELWLRSTDLHLIPKQETRAAAEHLGLSLR